MMDASLQPEQTRKRLNIDSPSFTPSNLGAFNGDKSAKMVGLSARAANAAPFKPRSLTPASSVDSYSPVATKAIPVMATTYNPAAPDWVSAAETADFQPQSFANLNLDTSGGSDFGSTASDLYGMQDLSDMGQHQRQHQHQAQRRAQQSTFQYPNGIALGSSNATGTTYLSTSSAHQSHLLQHHLYAPLDPRLDSSKPFQRYARDVFIPEDLRVKLYKKSEAAMRSFANSQLPNVENFHTLTPLEGFSSTSHLQQAGNRSGGIASNMQTSVYKAVSGQDGRTYCLRRFHNIHLTRDSPLTQAISMHKKRWGRVQSNSVVASHMAFTTQVFGDTSAILVSDFYADSSTLHDRYLEPNRFRMHASAGRPAIPESTLWNLIVQMANAIKSIHAQGLVLRNLDAKRWLVTDENRVRFNGCGMAEIIDANSTGLSLVDLQKQDLVNFGRLIVNLGGSGVHGQDGMSNAMKVGGQSHGITPKLRPSEQFIQLYSSKMKHAVEWLQQNVNATIIDFIPLISDAILETADAALGACDYMQHHLNAEVENGRLVRLLLKLNAINERPEYDLEGNLWRDQGQRAALGLFRDYVFHQVDGQGQPVLDMGHMLSCLNKLDVGIEERIMLMTRNEQTVMVVSYRELKAMFETAWNDVMRRSMGGSTGAAAQSSMLVAPHAHLQGGMMMGMEGS